MLKKPTTSAGTAFIAGAPDAAKAPASPRRRARKVPNQRIAFLIEPLTLERLDAAAGELGITRSAALQLAIRSWLADQRPGD